MNLDHSLTALEIGLYLGGTAVLTNLCARAYVAVCRALDTRTDRRTRRAAQIQHTAATTAVDDAVTLALDDACCEPWWTSCGADHDPTCHHQTPREP